MKFKLILLAASYFLTSSILPQNVESINSTFQKKNSLDLEIGGYTGVGAIYYERVIVNNQKFKTTGQVGYGLGGIPIIIHELISFNNNHLEFGLGIVFPEFPSKNIMNNTKPFVTGRIGYRYQKPDGSFVFRAGIMPVMVEDWWGFYPIFWVWPGISLGYSF
jgi:hypothetical protein